MDYDIRILAAIGVSVMLLLIVGFLLIMVMNQRKKWQLQKQMSLLKEQQQNQLIEAAVRSEEIERHRIAETLHDEVGAILSSAKMHLLRISTVSLNENDKGFYEKGSGLLNDVIQRVRGISHNLHSNILKEFGLNEAILNFTHQVTQGSLIDSTTSLDDKYAVENFENDISTYRIVQELTNNILKYAHPTKFHISTEFKEKEGMDITIFHNGQGLTQEDFEELRFQKDGLGLKNIQNRIILLKGAIHFNRENDGYYIKIHVPPKPNINA